MQQPARADDKKQLRGYYLTTTLHNGAQATTACAAGFHMASLWEMFDTSNLKYETGLGFTRPDSGFGPPLSLGWVRTGGNASFSTTPGFANCNAWTSDLAVRAERSKSGGNQPAHPCAAPSFECGAWKLLSRGRQQPLLSGIAAASLHRP
jgi:hypothetical protein